MLILAIIGVIALTFGVLVLIAPGLIKAISRSLDKVLVAVDDKLEQYKVSIGIISAAVGIVALFLAYYVVVM